MLHLFLLICDVEPIMILPFFINVEPFIYMKISFICDFAMLRDFFPFICDIADFLFNFLYWVIAARHMRQSPQGYFGQFRWRKTQNEEENGEKAMQQDDYV
jgi:hypothetical protein